MAVKNHMFSIPDETIAAFRTLCEKDQKKYSSVVSKLIQDYVDARNFNAKTDSVPISVKVPFRLLPLINDIIEKNSMKEIGIHGIKSIFELYINELKTNDMAPAEITIESIINKARYAELEAYFKQIGLPIDIEFMYYLILFVYNAKGK